MRLALLRHAETTFNLLLHMLIIRYGDLRARGGCPYLLLTPFVQRNVSRKTRNMVAAFLSHAAAIPRQPKRLLARQ